MSIDRQRIDGVKFLLEQGYEYKDWKWQKKRDVLEISNGTNNIPIEKYVVFVQQVRAFFGSKPANTPWVNQAVYNHIEVMGRNLGVWL